MREITESDLRHFREQGYLVVGPLVDEQGLQHLRNAFEELEARWSEECGVSLEHYRRVVSQWTGLWEQHPHFAEQIHHPSVEAVARRLLGVERLQLFHDHLISKPPMHSSTVPWHQDYPFWPVDHPRALSCWLSLDGATPESGALHFMPGAHLEGELPPVDFLAKNKHWGPRASQAVAVSAPPGYVVFHSCLSWHYSPPNQTQRPRRAFIAIYMDAECRWAPEHSGWHPMNDLVTVAPGERFNADRFPIIRRADLGEVAR
jgi:ectoine hydroxylase-related dioxygenase (phytanoyl-CoA dioxygenase family)